MQYKIKQDKTIYNTQHAKQRKKKIHNTQKERKMVYISPTEIQKDPGF